jgi:hypothetical protein
MSVNLTPKEMSELQGRFSTVMINETISNDTIVYTLSTGKDVNGVVTENGVQVKSVSELLFG